MARSYGKVMVEVWEPGSEFRALSLEAQWAYQMLISQESVSMAGTLSYAPRKWAKFAADLSVERLDEIIGELEREWYVILDRETEELLIRSFVKHNESWRTPNFFTAARSKYRLIESEAIREYLRDRHPWIAAPHDERKFHELKAEIDAYEERASARPSERTSPLPFEQASPHPSEHPSASRAPARSRSPNLNLNPNPKSSGVKGSGDTPRATHRSEAALRAEARSEDERALPVRAECPVCGPLHDVGLNFSLEDHLRNVHDVEPEAYLERSQGVA